MNKISCIYSPQELSYSPFSTFVPPQTKGRVTIPFTYIDFPRYYSWNAANKDWGKTNAAIEGLKLSDTDCIFTEWKITELANIIARGSRRAVRTVKTNYEL
jgi:hypothetical protein